MKYCWAICGSHAISKPGQNAKRLEAKLLTGTAELSSRHGLVEAHGCHPATQKSIPPFNKILKQHVYEVSDIMTSINCFQRPVRIKFHLVKRLGQGGIGGL